MVLPTVDQYVNSRNGKKRHQPCGTIAVLEDYTERWRCASLYKNRQGEGVPASLLRAPVLRRVAGLRQRLLRCEWA